MKLSILIPVFNQVHFTKQVIQSIQDNISGLIEYEIIILNNGSTDGTKEYLIKLQGEEFLKGNNNLTIITLPKNIYVNNGWNLLAKEAKGEYLLFLNNDITLFKNFDIKLISYHENGKITCPATCQNGESTWFRQGANINGTCFMIKKEDYAEIPNELKLWWGDDFLFRIFLVNWINEYVIHWGSQTLSKLPEVNEIIDNDRKEWIKICLEKGWEDKRFKETFINNYKK